MGIGASILLIAVGAVLDFAMHVHDFHGVNLNTVGVILMVVGAIGLIVSLIVSASMSRRAPVHSQTVVRDREAL